VVVNILDQFSGSVHFTGIDVILTDLSGTVLGRVPRRGAMNFGTTLTWTGRIRTSKLPEKFKIVVTATDRAGNVAVVQEVTISTTSRSSGRGDDDDDDDDDDKDKKKKRKRWNWRWGRR
jgi:hypothetical protein